MNSIIFADNFEIPDIEIPSLIDAFSDAVAWKKYKELRATILPDTQTTQPKAIDFFNIDKLNKLRFGRIRAENSAPGNWAGFSRNIPFEISAYFLRDAITTKGGFNNPHYETGLRFLGRRIGLHSSGACLLLNDKSLFEQSFGYQDSHISLPESHFGINSSGFFLKDEEAFENLSCEEIEDPCYFLGNMLPHFGHFILDGMSRLWLLKYIPSSLKDKLKFVIYDNQLPNWALDLLLPFGITKDNIIYTNRNLRFKRLLVPGNSYHTHIKGHSEFQNCLNDVTRKYAPEKKPHKKIYLSRRFQKARKLKNEEELESFFESMGFEIIVSEKLSISEQVSIAATASILAGTTGSSMYLAGFQAANTKTIIFAPNNFLLADDFIFASIGHREIHFALGNETIKIDNADRRASEWTIDFDSQLKQSIIKFIHRDP